MKYSICAILFLNATHSNAQFTISASVMPPYSNRLTDYTQKPGKLTVIMTSSYKETTKTVYLEGKLTSLDGDVEIYTRPGTKPKSGGITVMASGMRTLTFSEITAIFDDQVLLYKGISREQVLKDGLPEGAYRFCFKVYDYATNQLLSNEETGCSNMFNLSAVEAPIIINPQNNSEISSVTPQNIQFNWIMPAGAPLGIKYTLKIVELDNPNRNPDEAMNSTGYPVFFESEVNSTIYLYTVANPPLTKGKKYAFRVTAHETSTATPERAANTYFRNGGKSEVFVFTYGESNATITAPAININNSQTKPNKVTASTTPDFNNVAQLRPVTVKGKLMYKFKEDGTGAALSNKRISLIDRVVLKYSGGNFYWVNAKSNTNNPEANAYLTELSHAYGYYEQGGKTGTTIIMNPDGTTSAIQGVSEPGWVGNTDETVATGYTDANGNFELHGLLSSVKEPYNNSYGKIFDNTEICGTVVTSSTWIDAQTTGTVTDGGVANPGYTPGQWLTETATECHSGNLWRVLRIKVEDDIYFSPELDILANNPVINIGTRDCQVRTFTAKGRAVFNPTMAQNQDLYEVAPGHGIPGMVAHIARQSQKLLPEEGTSQENKTLHSLPVLSSIDTDVEGWANLSKLVLCNTGFYYKFENKVVEDGYGFDEMDGNFSLNETHNSFSDFRGTYNDENTKNETADFCNKMNYFMPLKPIISGRVKGVFNTNLEGTEVKLVDDDTNNPDIPNYITLADGFFEFRELDHTKVYTLYFQKKGYQYMGPVEVNGGQHLKMGRRFFKEYVLQPSKKVRGTVEDELGRGLSCYIGIGGVTMDQQNMQTFHPQCYTYFCAPTTFEVAMPGDKVRLIIRPFDENYKPVDTLLNLTTGNINNLKIVVKLIQNRLKLKVKGSRQISANPDMFQMYSLANARVVIPGIADTLYTNSQGELQRNFFSSGSSDMFDIKVFGPKGKYFEPKIFTLQIPRSTETSSYTVTIKEATYIAGYVKVGSKGIPGVTVRVKNSPASYAQQITASSTSLGALTQSQGGGTHQVHANSINATMAGNAANNMTTVNTNTSNITNVAQNFNSSYSIYEPSIPIETVTDATGHFLLPNLPIYKNILISASQPGTQYIGDIDTVKTKPSGIDDALLTLWIYNDMNITRMLGFKMAVEDLTDEGGIVKISGYLTDAKPNPSFTASATEKFNFDNLTIQKGSIAPGDTLPAAVPLNNVVVTNKPDCELMAYNYFNAILKKDNGTLEIKEYTKPGGGKVGGIVGKVQLKSQYFQISNLTFNTELQLNLIKPNNTRQMTFAALNADGSAVTESPKGFAITAPNGDTLRYNILDYACTSDPSQSLLNKDTLFLYTILHTQLQNVKPADLKLVIGKIAVRKDTMAIQTKGTLPTLKLQTWQIIPETWTLNNQGLKITKGNLNMNGLYIPFTDMRIYPTFFYDATYQFQNIKLLGITDLAIQPGFDNFLHYDDLTGSWEMKIFKDNGYCASISNLPAWNPGDALYFNTINLYSNGYTSYYNIADNQPKLTIHKLLPFNPQSFVTGPDYFQIRGEFNLQIPNCTNDVDNTDEYYSKLTYKKTGNALELKEVDKFTFQINTNGVKMKFPAINYQSLTQESFTANGTIEEEGIFKFNVRLLKTNQKTDVVVDPLHQNWNFSGGKSLKEITGQMEVISNNTAWNRFAFEGDVTESVFTGAKGRLRFTVKGDLEVDNSSIGVTNVPTALGMVGLTYDMNEKCLRGNTEINQDLPTGHISGGLEIRFDANGWYFVGGGTLKPPTNPLCNQLSVGMVFADYPKGSQSLMNKFSQYTSSNEVPALLQGNSTQKFKGFYFYGGASMPILPILPPIDINVFGIVGVWWNVEFGGNLGFGLNFADNGTEVFVQGTVFVSAEFGVKLLVPAACLKASVEGWVGVSASGLYNTGTHQFSFTGKGVIGVDGKIFVEVCPCPWDCTLLDVNYDKSFGIEMTADGDGLHVNMYSGDGHKPY